MFCGPHKMNLKAFLLFLHSGIVEIVRVIHSLKVSQNFPMKLLGPGTVVDISGGGIETSSAIFCISSLLCLFVYLFLISHTKGLCSVQIFPLQWSVLVINFFPRISRISHKISHLLFCLWLFPLTPNQGNNSSIYLLVLLPLPNFRVSTMVYKLYSAPGSERAGWQISELCYAFQQSSSTFFYNVCENFT